LSQIAGCLDCRQVFNSAPKCCPFCNAATFVHVNESEDLNSVCEELLFLAKSLQNEIRDSQTRSKRLQTAR